MPRKSLLVAAARKPKFSTRVVRRCWYCGRKRGYMREFGLCRIDFRRLASEGKLPGIKKASW